jgi:hypothetical protein
VKLELDPSKIRAPAVVASKRYQRCPRWPTRRGLLKQMRTRAVSARQVRAYVGEAEEYLAAASAELEAGRVIAATSLALHAGINAADALTGVRLGRRAAGQDTTRC